MFRCIIINVSYSVSAFGLMYKRQYLIPDVSAFQDRVGMFANHLLLQVVEHTHPQQHPFVEKERFKCLNADGFPMYTQIK